MQKEFEERRDAQRTTTLLRRREEFSKLVKTGVLTQEDADAALKKLQEQGRLGADEPPPTAANPSPLPSLLIGKANLPTSRSQTWTSRNPYLLKGDDVEEVGQQSTSKKAAFMTIR